MSLAYLYIAIVLLAVLTFGKIEPNWVEWLVACAVGILIVICLLMAMATA